MFKDLKIKNILPTIIIVAIFILAVWFLFVKKDKPVTKTESSFEPNTNPERGSSREIIIEKENSDRLPGLSELQYQISTKGKKKVFPFIIEKITDGPIELPNRRSLLNKDDKYKFIDVIRGQRIKIVSLQALTYTVNHQVLNDDFLITDNDYLIAYSQAMEHFKLAK